MASQREISLFATKSDHQLVLEKIDQMCSLKYILYGTSRTEEFITSASCLTLPGFGFVSSGVAILGPIIIILDEYESTQITKSQLKTGEVRYNIFHGTNPNSVEFRPGGLFEDCLIEGSLSTINESVKSLELFSIFTQEYKHQFRQINGAWIGPEAFLLLNNHKRLTDDARSPKSWDFKI